MSTLIVNEIYASIQGESRWAGYPCVFVRLTGCPLRCSWCDTPYSYDKGQKKSVEEIVQEVLSFKVPLVELTGGEPLAHEGVLDLLKSLHENNLEILIETSGSECIQEASKYAHIIMDVKCPGSKMEKFNKLSNLEYIRGDRDEIKFVVKDRMDFEWALEFIREHKLESFENLSFSPVFGKLKPDLLSKWLVEEAPLIRLNLQIHKYIWSPKARGV
jgi:7-carboxy-7-deazaguanine synthase